MTENSDDQPTGAGAGTPAVSTPISGSRPDSGLPGAVAVPQIIVQVPPPLGLHRSKLLLLCLLSLLMLSLLANYWLLKPSGHGKGGPQEAFVSGD